MNVKRVIVFLQLLETIYGVIDLTCDTANPSTQTNVTCVCTRKNGSSIKWYFDGISVADCFLTKGCFPKPDSYTFSINVSEFAYEMTKSGYDYNDCTPIQCTDAGDTSIEKTVVPAPVNFDPSNSTTITEPISNHTDGTVSITTGCISGYIDVKCEWYIVYDEKEEIYKHGQSAFDTYDNSTCSNCINDVLAKKTCGFIHEEASGNETKIVYFKVVLTHTPTNFKWKVKSANVYTVKVNMYEPSSKKNTGWKKIPFVGRVFIIIIIAVVVVAGIVAAFYGLFCKKPAVIFECRSNDTNSISVELIVSAWNFCTTNFEITCEMMTVDESNVDIDKVWAKEKSDPKFTNNRVCIKNTILKEKAIVFNNLYTGTYYTVTVVARTICKEDKASRILQTEIATPYITSPGISLSADKICLSWMLIDVPNRANHLKYSVTYKRTNVEEDPKIIHSINTTKCTLKELSRDTNYDIKVFAYSCGKFGNPGEKTIQTVGASRKKSIQAGGANKKVNSVKEGTPKQGLGNKHEKKEMTDRSKVSNSETERKDRGASKKEENYEVDTPEQGLGKEGENKETTGSSEVSNSVTDRKDGGASKKEENDEMDTPEQGLGNEGVNKETTDSSEVSNSVTDSKQKGPNEISIGDEMKKQQQEQGGKQ